MVLCTVLAVAALLSSCHGIYNDLEPCTRGVRLRFVYDYNMEYANAFHSQVDCLALTNRATIWLPILGQVMS